MQENSQFIKFIIKEIVKGISYDTTSLDFLFNRVVVSDKTMNNIIEEGKNYSYTQEDVKKSIEYATKEISLAPRREELYSCLDISKLIVGQHLKISFHNEITGMHMTELLLLEKNRFLVLNSDNNSIQKGDEFIALNILWNVNYCTEFCVFRNDSRYPDADSIFRTPKITLFELFYPSILHEVYDSESDYKFRMEKSEGESDGSLNTHLWHPSIQTSSPDCLNELRASIIDAIKNCYVKQEYPKWILQCRIYYGISSYTLQLLITFYTKYLNEKDTLIPASNVDCFIKYNFTEKVDIDPITVVPNEDKKKPNKNRLYIVWTTIFIILILLALRLATQKKKTVEEKKIDLNGITINKIGELLASPTITIDSITAIEKAPIAQNTLQNKELNFHFVALNHIYLNGFMAENHSVQGLRNIYAIHADEFSPSQQRIMDWYFKQDSKVQELWEICDKASSFADFKSKIKEQAKKYNLNIDDHE